MGVAHALALVVIVLMKHIRADGPSHTAEIDSSRNCGSCMHNLTTAIADFTSPKIFHICILSASPLITCTIITSCTLLPCDLTQADLTAALSTGVVTMSSLAQCEVQHSY